jgi:hypothetical protein
MSNKQFLAFKQTEARTSLALAVAIDKMVPSIDWDNVLVVTTTR